MKIGLISDTHIPSAGDAPPAEVEVAFKDVDLILHAGHAYVSSCLDWLGRIAPVRASESWLVGSGESFTRNGMPLVVEAEGHTIGMVHELILRCMSDDILPGAIGSSFPASESLPATLKAIFGQPVDIVVFGYTHEAMVEEHEGVLLVNPGSPSMVRQQVRLGTVAILEVTPERREARIVDLSSL